MKVTIEESQNLDKDHIILKCHKHNDTIEDIKNNIENSDIYLIGTNEKEQIRVKPKDILYIESVDKRTYFYLTDMILEANYRLYELEKSLNNHTFFRCSKSTIVNINHIYKIVPMLNRNLMLTMYNNEKIILSRRKRKDFNQLIGMER